MRGQLLAFGFLLIIAIIGTAALVKLVSSSPVEETIATSEGNVIAAENYVELIVRTFDQSIEPISQKTAYDLGLKGGLRRERYWTEFYPTFDVLESEFEETLKENLPEGRTDAGRKITWGAGGVDVKDYDTSCGPIEDSTCFVVDGIKDITIHDDPSDTTAFLNPHKFETRVSSNYFKLMNAALTAMQDYADLLDDAGAFVNALYEAKSNGDTNFEDLDFFPVVNGNVVTIHIWEKCWPLSSDTYCLSPLSEGEIGLTEPGGNIVPYDYNRFVFKYYKEQTGFTELVNDFQLSINPPYGVKLESCG